MTRIGRASPALAPVATVTPAGWSYAFSAAATAMDARIKLAAITTARKSNNIVAVLHWYRERPTAQKVQGREFACLVLCP
jgi:hypothetical protein